MSDHILDLEGESFHGSARNIEVRGTDSGVIIIRVSTRGGTIVDTTQVALTCEELEYIHTSINGA